MNDTRAHVAVVGGGLAGIATALQLVDAGQRVTLFESRPRLGGATWSFTRDGRNFDNGQHVFLRCCDAYRRLLDRLGTTDKAPIQERLEIPVLRARPGRDPVMSVISRSSLPAPLHLGRSLVAYRHLSSVDRLRLGGAVRAMMEVSATDPLLDQETFGAFLRRHGQSSVAVANLWDLIALPTTNLRADEVSAAVAVKVFKTGLLEHADAADIGWARVPLLELHGTPARHQLEASGARVALRSKVEGFDVEARDGGAHRVVAVRTGGESVPVDAVVMAVPHLQAATLAPEAAKLNRRQLLALGASPIIDVHVVYAGPVMDYPIAAGLDSSVQYVFDTSESAGVASEGIQCLAVSVSGADAEHGEQAEILIERYLAALSDLFPRARSTQVLDAVVTREHQATFRAVPGTASMRPGPVTGLPNFFLAGSWTDTGWPATMEGAVRSGNRAAWHVRNLCEGGHVGLGRAPEAAA
ncbi:MAG TPA: hydroxysqualene dehydroxylase HpnE [Acidimicrobiales bacterium]